MFLSFLLSFGNRCRRDVRGQDLIEYALVAALVATVGALVLPGLGSLLSSIFSYIEKLVESAASQGS